MAMTYKAPSHGEYFFDGFLREHVVNVAEIDMAQCSKRPPEIFCRFRIGAVVIDPHDPAGVEVRDGLDNVL